MHNAVNEIAFAACKAKLAGLLKTGLIDKATYEKAHVALAEKLTILH